MKVAIIGGTGTLGRGLAVRLAAGHSVVIGSRDAAKAEAAAQRLAQKGVTVGAATSPEAAQACEAAILAIPELEDPSYLAELADALAKKLVVSPIVPMKSDGGALVYSLASGSAAERVAEVLAGSRVAAALHTVPAPLLAKPEVELHCDSLVAADSRETFDEAARLIQGIAGVRALYAGPLSAARSIEELTPLLLNVARLNGLRNLSVRFA